MTNHEPSVEAVTECAKAIEVDGTVTPFASMVAAKVLRCAVEKCWYIAPYPGTSWKGYSFEEDTSPTKWAYEQACKALHAQRERAEKAEAALKELERATCKHQFQDHPSE